MNRIFRIFSLVMMFAIIASLAGMSVTPVGAQSTSDALVQLSVVSDSFSASQGVMVHVIITNPNAGDLRVLSWQTPANGVQGALFTVTRNGAPVNYLGALYKRAAPTDQDYITLAAGKSLEYDVNLSQYYSFTESGHYAIKYNTGSQDLYAASGPGKLVSNQLVLNVDGRPDPIQKLIVPEIVTGSTTFYSCSGTQQTALLTARNDASTYANNGKTYFSNNRAGSLYQLWFGIYNASRWALPKSHYSLISNATDTATIDFDCTCTDSGVYAYVYPSSPYDVYLCGAFWNAPATGTDSKAGTLIHEMSHFTILGGTDDYVYGQTGAKALAINNPAQAVMNADNHEYFVENTPYTADNAAAYTLGETSFNFGDQPAGSSSAVHIFTITSRGDTNVSFGQVAVSGQFSLQNDTCSYNAFGTGDTCTFGISFAPTSTGAKAGTVTIPSNAVIATSVSLAGNGTANVTPPTVVSITRVGATPTIAASVDFSVIFSEAVTGVDTTDFGLTTTGSVSGAAVAGVSGSGTTFTITASTGSGIGTLRLDVLDTANIVDLSSSPLANLPYLSGEVYHRGVQTFADVPVTHSAWSWIERLYAAGITGGCGSMHLIYCPNNSVTRAQMAVFLLRSIHGSMYTPPAATGTVFGDVPLTHPQAAWIEQLYTEGITGGCGGGNYCPTNSVTRAQMAVFLLRAKHGASYAPPAASGTMFSDVPLAHPQAAWIEQLSNEGISGGCGGGNYCPGNPAIRAQMAIFLVRTFNLP